MQERKNKRLLLLLLVLTGVTVIALALRNRSGQPVVDKTIFKGYDLKTVDEVRLESAKEKILLNYNGARWKINTGYNADPAMIEVLFATLQQAEPKRRIPSRQQDSVATRLKQHGVKVSLFSGGAEQVSFYAGGNATKTQGIFMRETEDIPYMMTIPGYRVYVPGIFELSETGWRDKYVFGFNWRNFQQLQVSFPRKPAENFSVVREDGVFTVKGMSAVDTTKLNTFLDDVSLLTVAEYISADAKRDSLAKTVPRIAIEVKDIAGKIYSLELYPVVGKNGLYAGWIDKKQWALFQQNSISRIYRSRNFFGK